MTRYPRSSREQTTTVCSLQNRCRKLGTLNSEEVEMILTRTKGVKRNVRLSEVDSRRDFNNERMYLVHPLAVQSLMCYLLPTPLGRPGQRGNHMRRGEVPLVHKCMFFDLFVAVPVACRSKPHGLPSAAGRATAVPVGIAMIWYPTGNSVANIHTANPTARPVATNPSLTRSEALHYR